MASTYLSKCLVAIDQLANAVAGGHPDETLSARAHRAHMSGRSGWRNAFNAIFFWQKDHCLSAYVNELARRHMPKSYAKEARK